MSEITNIAQLADSHGYLSHLRDINVLKALDGYGQVSQTLERQDLEDDMERLNILETPFYERLGKIKATALDHEYNVITSRQDKIGYAAYRDGTVPRTVEFEVTRRRTLPCFIGHRITMSEITLANTENGVKQIEQVAKDEKIVAVMEETEFLLFHGDRRFGSTDQTAPTNLQFNGIERIIKTGAPQNVLDLGGKPLSLSALWAAENRVYQTQGLARPDTVYISPIDKINLQASFYQAARINQSERAAGVLGATAQSFISAYGESELVPSRFVGNFHRFTSEPAGNVTGDFARPLPPTITTSAKATIGLDGLTNGTTYKYALKAASFDGESMAVESGNIAIDSDTEQSVLTLGNIHPATKWFIVYRAEVVGGVVKDYQFLKKVPYFNANTFEITDDGHESLVSPYGEYRFKRIPGTGSVYGVDMKTTNIAQWISLELMPLPQTLNRDWAVRHVMSLFSRAPEFSYAIVNVGQESIVA